MLPPAENLFRHWPFAGQVLALLRRQSRWNAMLFLSRSPGGQHRFVERFSWDGIATVDTNATVARVLLGGQHQRHSRALGHDGDDSSVGNRGAGGEAGIQSLARCLLEAHDGVRMDAGDREGVERLMQYFLCCPFSQARMICLCVPHADRSR